MRLTWCQRSRDSNRSKVTWEHRPTRHNSSFFIRETTRQFVALGSFTQMSIRTARGAMEAHSSYPGEQLPVRRRKVGGRILAQSWSTILFLAVLSAAALLLAASASRAPPVSSRSYAHVSTAHLSAIAALTDPAQSLDHRNPDSFVSKILIPRVPGTEGIKKARQHILDVFQKQLGPDEFRGRSGWKIEEHHTEDFTPHGKKPFVNLIFTKNPSASRRLVISAHYDSKWFNTGKFVGAIDSASPCAMLIDLALAIDPLLEARIGPNEDTTLELLFFDGEEAFDVWTHTDSTYGSRALAANWSQTWNTPRRLTTHTSMRRIDTIDHLVLLDLLGAKDPVIPSYYASTHWLFNKLVSAEDRLRKAGALWPPHAAHGDSRVPKSFFDQTDRHMGGGIEDDHLPFLANGVPILHLVPSPFPRVWHTLKVSFAGNFVSFMLLADN